MTTFDAIAFVNSVIKTKQPPQNQSPRVYGRGWNAERVERMKQSPPSRFSTGPKTPEGKAKSRLNSFKHGRYSRAMLDVNLIANAVAREMKMKY